MIVQVTTLRHLEQKRKQQVRVFPDALEVAFGLRLCRSSRALCGKSRSHSEEQGGDEE